MLRQLIREMLVLENGPEAHILNFYEDLDMPLSEFKEAIRALLDAQVEDVEEKMDGQNLTFTVRNGEVETFSKGVSWAGVQRGGKKLADYEAQYADRPSVRDAFTRSYSSLQAAADGDPELTRRLFRDGGVVVESLMMLPENPNTIVYDRPTIRFVRAYPMDPALEGQVDQEAYRAFLQRASGLDVPVPMGEVPILKLRKVMDSEKVAADLEGQLDSLMAEAGVNDSGTMGDLIVGLVKTRLEADGMSPDVARRVAVRLGRGEKAAFSAKDAKAVGPGVWEKVQGMEAGPYVDEAIIPIERILQKLAVQVFRNLDFVLSSNRTESGEALRSFVRQTRDAVKGGRLIADPGQTEAIRVALERIGDEAAFEKAVEGIVFRWKGKTRKLTGLFTPINKLRGFFAYGKTPARISQNEARKRYLPFGRIG